MRLDGVSDNLELQVEKRYLGLVGEWRIVRRSLAFGWKVDSVFNDGGQVLQNQPPRDVWASSLNSIDISACSSTDINQQHGTLVLNSVLSKNCFNINAARVRPLRTSYIVIFHIVIELPSTFWMDTNVSE